MMTLNANHNAVLDALDDAPWIRIHPGDDPTNRGVRAAQATSIKWLAQVTGKSYTTIHRAVTELREMGLVNTRWSYDLSVHRRSLLVSASSTLVIKRVTVKHTERNELKNDYLA